MFGEPNSQTNENQSQPGEHEGEPIGVPIVSIDHIGYVAKGSHQTVDEEDRLLKPNSGYHHSNVSKEVDELCNIAIITMTVIERRREQLVSIC